MWLALFPSAWSAAPLEVPCCSSRVARDSANFLLRLQDALSEPSGRSFEAQLYGWRGALSRSDPSLNGPARDAVAGLREVVERARQQATRTKTIALLPELTRHVTFLVLAHPGGDLRLAEGVCGERIWLQRADRPLEPPAGVEGCTPAWLMAGEAPR